METSVLEMLASRLSRQPARAPAGDPAQSAFLWTREAPAEAFSSLPGAPESDHTILTARAR